MEVQYSSRFKRRYKKLPMEIKILAEKREQLFRDNPYNPLLSTHNLTAGDNDVYE